jgi:hypothetical protein
LHEVAEERLNRWLGWLASRTEHSNAGKEEGTDEEVFPIMGSL